MNGKAWTAKPPLLGLLLLALGAPCAFAAEAEHPWQATGPEMSPEAG